jgi:uncharacterized protein (DUF1501 family)
MTLSRRELLGGTAWAAAAGLWPLPGLQRLAFGAEPGADGILVVLHLRGGCDGLNLLSPAGDPDFVAARNSDLRVLGEGPEAGRLVAHAQNPGLEFRLHNAAGALADLCDARHLAFVHAAGLTDTTRSHFVATDMIEHGVADGRALNSTSSGWLTRAMQRQPSLRQPSLRQPSLRQPAQPGLLAAGRGTVRAVSTSGSPSGAWAGNTDTISVGELANGLGAPGGAQTDQVLQQLYGGGSEDAISVAGRLTLDAMAAIDVRLPRDTQGRYVAYAPDAGVNFEAAHEFGRPLKTLSQLIKMDVGLRAATVDLGGWDTHEYQPGRFKNQVERLSQGLGAFYNDMSRYHERLVVVVVTEFGRRLRSNRSNGTDHGRGSVMMVLGGGVAGGRIYGRWPGLKSEQLEEGVDLAVVNDYRQGLTEVLKEWRGGEQSAVFPGFVAGERLGLFGPSAA